MGLLGFPSPEEDVPSRRRQHSTRRHRLSLQRKHTIAPGLSRVAPSFTRGRTGRRQDARTGDSAGFVGVVQATRLHAGPRVTADCTDSDDDGWQTRPRTVFVRVGHRSSGAVRDHSVTARMRRRHDSSSVSVDKFPFHRRHTLVCIRPTASRIERARPPTANRRSRYRGSRHCRDETNTVCRPVIRGRADQTTK